ncbi:MAG: hypothetical protein WCA10_24730 [Terracidiphilus sp.]
MSNEESLPSTFSINAWTGAEVPATPVASTWRQWAVARHQQIKVKPLAADEPVDLRDWWDERVGWGLVLRDNDALSESNRATGTDVPEELRPLLEKRRGSPILRYRPEAGGESLRRYYTDRPAQSVMLSGSQRGTAPGRLPRYLLIYGSPTEVPWDFQYLLNGPCYTGRLDLTGEALSNYIAALINNWCDAKVKSDQPLIWTVDKGPNDITFLMRYLIAEPVRAALDKDPQVKGKVRHLAGPDATVDKLAAALKDPDRPPAMIVSTSHGMTGPIDNPKVMGRDLGLLVDANSQLVRPESMLDGWNPNGAIWYSHACCSAGSNNKTAYLGLVPPGSPVEQILLAVAGLGAHMAPFPRALLGAKQPLRAFIGHIEPTFDWTIRNPESKQPLTSTVVQALYNRMYRTRPEPVGLAFSDMFALVGQLFQQWSQAKDGALDADAAIRQRNREVALRTQLTALDREACVILGDPTVALPPI